MSHDTLPAPYKRHTLRHRHKTTIRIDPELWEEFKGEVTKKGLSTCLVLEGLINAWIYGASAVPGIQTPMKVDLTINEVVSRRRRAAALRVSEKEWDDWVRYYEDTWLFTPVKVGPRRYRLYPV